MPELSSEKREELPESAFACPRDRKLPLVDAEHVRNAMARFNQVHSDVCHPREAKRRIIAAAKKFGIDVEEFKKVKRFEGHKD